MNLYLSFDHHEQVSGQDYYFFRSGLFQGGILEDLLLLVADLEMLSILFLPAKIPSKISEGSIVGRLDGGDSYEVPEDIYLIAIQDWSFSSVGDPLTDFLESGFTGQALAIYSPYPPGDESLVYLPSADPEIQEPNIPTYPEWYVPEIALKDTVVANSHTDVPLWAQTDFSLWFAFGDYSGDNYGCLTESTAHITCNPGNLDEYIPPTEYNERHFWKETLSSRQVRSNLESPGWEGLDIWHEFSGDMRNLYINLYRVSDRTDPVVWFAPDYVAPSDYDTPIYALGFTALAAAVASGSLKNSKGLFSDLKIHIKPSSDNRYGLAGELEPLAGVSKALVTTNI